MLEIRGQLSRDDDENGIYGKERGGWMEFVDEQMHMG